MPVWRMSSNALLATSLRRRSSCWISRSCSVAEPKSDHSSVRAGLEQFHGGGVPQHVGRYSFLAQRNAVFPRLRHVAREQMLYAVGT